MIYGVPQIARESDVTDRLGIRTLILSQMWQPSRGDISQTTLDAEVPNIPAVPGGIWLIGTQTRRYGGAMKTTWTFEGINGDGKSVTFKNRQNSFDYEFEPGFSQVPIQLHPDFYDLLETYGGLIDDENVIWPSTMPDSGGGGGGGLSGGKDKKSEPNPMFGKSDFFRTEGSYRFRYVDRDVPAIASSKVGKAHSSGELPGRPPSYADRDWLKLAPQIVRRGPTVHLITEVYWLSGPGGWPEPIYRS